MTGLPVWFRLMWFDFLETLAKKWKENNGWKPVKDVTGSVRIAIQT